MQPRRSGRLFLTTYTSAENYKQSVRVGVFGAPNSNAVMEAKVRELKRGDLILIRDSSASHNVTLLGCGVVVGDVFHQDTTTPFRDLLWPDEVRANQVLYKLRVPVDFKTVTPPARQTVTWSDLDRLQILGSENYPILGAQAWAKKFSGNAVRDIASGKAICDLFGIAPL